MVSIGNSIVMQTEKVGDLNIAKGGNFLEVKSFKFDAYLSFVVCPAGLYYNSENGNVCEACPVDTYSSSIESTACMGCPVGTNTEQKTGQVAIDACGKGKLQCKNNRSAYIQLSGICNNSPI